MKSLSVDPVFSSTETQDDALYALLKGAEAPETNESSSTKGVNNVYPNPVDYETLDADPNQHGDAVRAQHHNVREGVLERQLSGKRQADQVHRAAISQNFQHGAAGQYTAHSVHLQARGEKVAYQRAETLAEAVKKKLGHY